MNMREMVWWFANGVHGAGESERTVNVIARELQKAGHIKTGKPGRHGGSQMDDHDAAALVIALLAGERGRAVIEAADAVQILGRRRAHLEFPVGGPGLDAPPVSEVLGLPPGHAFFDVIRAAVRTPREQWSAAGRPVLWFRFRIEFPRQTVAAEFGFKGMTPPLGLHYGRPGAREEYLGDPFAPGPRELEKERRLGSNFFAALHHQIYSGPQPPRPEGAEVPA